MKKQLVTGLAIGSVLLASSAFAAATITATGTISETVAVEKMEVNGQLVRPIVCVLGAALAEGKQAIVTYSLPEGYKFKDPTAASLTAANGSGPAIAVTVADPKGGNTNEVKFTVTAGASPAVLAADSVLTFNAIIVDKDGALMKPNTMLKATIDAVVDGSPLDPAENVTLAKAVKGTYVPSSVIGRKSKLTADGEHLNALLDRKKTVMIPFGFDYAGGFAFTDGDDVTITLTSSNDFANADPALFYFDPEGDDNDSAPKFDGKDVKFIIDGSKAVATINAKDIKAASQIVYSVKGGQSLKPFEFQVEASERIASSRYTGEIDGLNGAYLPEPLFRAIPEGGYSVFTAPLVQVPGGWFCRTAFSNTTNKKVEFTVKGYSEEGAEWALKETTGTIPANGDLIVDCDHWVDMEASGNRGSLVFTLKADASSSVGTYIHGVYQLVNPATGSSTNMAMPYSQP